jgi:uncharacterized protein
LYPVWIFTGYKSVGGAIRRDELSPLSVLQLVREHADTRFVLFHAGFPYQDELLTMAKHLPNVWVDLCWAWSISPQAIVRTLREALHAVPSHRILGFGGDTYWPVAAVGYAAQARRWAFKAFEAEVVDGSLGAPRAIELATRIMRSNALELYDVADRRAAVLAAAQGAGPAGVRDPMVLELPLLAATEDLML